MQCSGLLQLAGWPCCVQGCCSSQGGRAVFRAAACLTPAPNLCSRPSVSLQDAHLGAMGQVVNKFVGVSMVAPATRPRELATALLDSWGLTAALVSGQAAGLDGLLLKFWKRG